MTARRRTPRVGGRARVLLIRIGALLLASVALQTTSLAQDSAFETVIEGSLLRNSAISRLSDIFRLIPTFSMTSLDGFQTTGSLGSTSPYQTQGWRVAIDGRDISRPSMWNIHAEALPVPVSVIDRVIVDPAPGLGPGGISRGGWIRIETLPPPLGPRLAASAAVGNEAGDPGPFRYTELATPNVDRVGPTADGRLSYATRRWWAEIDVRADQSHPTDSQIIRRVEQLYAQKPLITLLHPQIQIGRRGPGGEHRLSADATLLRDLVFLEAVGSEVPTTFRSGTIEAWGDFSLRHLNVRYAFSASRMGSKERVNRRDLDLDWTSDKVGGRLEVAGARGCWTWGASAQGWYTALESTQVPDGAAVFLPELGAVLRLGSSNAWSHSLTGQFPLPLGSVTPVTPSFVYEIDSGRRPLRFSLRASILTEAGADRVDEAFWIRQGWDYPGDGAGRTAATATPSVERSLSVDATIRSESHAGFAWGLTGFVRAFSDLNLAQVSLIPDSLSESRYLASRSFIGGRSGQIHGARAWYRQTVGAHMWQRVDYAYRVPTSGGDVPFAQAWDPLPRVEMRYLFSVEAVPRTTLLLAARFRSSTSWPSISSGPFTLETEKLPASVAIDVTVTKRLWGPRMRAFFSFQNLSGGPGKSHPLGTQEDLTLVVGLGLGGGGG